MSKFFAEGNASDEEDSNEEEKEEMKNPNYKSDFMSDERTNNEKRKVLTEKEKRWSALRELSNKIISALKSNDYERVWSLFQDLLKQIEKGEKVIEKEGYPVFFLKLMSKINEDINGLTPEEKKKMKKGSSTSYNIMKQKLKKIYPEYEPQIRSLLEKGDVEEENDEEEVESEEDSSSDQEEDDKKLLQSKDPMERRKYWLKKPDAAKQKKDKQEENAEEQKGKIDKKDKEQKDKEEKKDEKKKKKEIAPLSKKKSQIASVKDAEILIRNIIGKFAKLNTQQLREEYLESLNEIAEKSKSYQDSQKLSFLLVDVPIRIEVANQMKSTHFSRKHWLLMFSHIQLLYTIFKESEDQDLLEHVVAFAHGAKGNKVQVTELSIYLSIKASLIIIETELKKAFMFIDNAEVEYADRLQDLIRLIELMYKVSRDFAACEKRINQSIELSFKVLENVYFMSSEFLEKLQEDSQEKLAFIELGKADKLQEYVMRIIRQSQDEEVRTKGYLYLIYNHALNRRDCAKELLVISSIPESIHSCEYYTQAIFNRTVAQIGVNAFYHGNMFQVQQYLSELCSFGKNKDQSKEIIREFFAQGYSRTVTEKEIPRNKILPYYLHLSIEVIESIELIASMLLEIPYTLSEGGRITSKTFKKVYNEYQRSHFIAEPLNNRDLIYAASSELKQGGWRECYQRLLELSIWENFAGSDTAKGNLLRVIKEQALKCYLIGNRKCFKSVSLTGLTAKFELDVKDIRKIICKMIYERQIQGSLTHNGFLNLVQKKQSEMQKICEGLFGKLTDMMQANEKIFSQRVHTVPEDQDDEVDREESKFTRKMNIAINEKLKSILSKRNEKHV